MRRQHPPSAPDYASQLAAGADRLIGRFGEVGAQELLEEAFGENQGDMAKRKEGREVIEALLDIAIQAKPPATTQSDAEATQRSAADDPLPPPPGELGRRAQEHLPSTGDHEQSQTPEEPDARADTGG